MLGSHMSAYNLLMNHDEPIPVRASSGPKGIALLAANHQVPILWMALFGPADIRRMSLPDSEVGDIPTMMASTADALRRYASRKGALRRALDARHFDRIAEWERFIQTGLTKAYVQIDFEDFCLVGDLPAFEAELVTWLDGVEHMSGSGWNALCVQANLDNLKLSPYGMRGFGHEVDPWP